MKINIFLLLILSISVASAQGWIPDDAAYSSTPLVNIYGGGAKSENMETTVDRFRLFLPTPSNQGTKASCLTEAICHALTMKKALDMGMKNKDEINAARFSAPYLYNQVAQNNCATGSMFETVLKIVETKGVCLEKLFNPSDCSTQPQNEQHQAASQNKIRGFQRLFDPKDDPNEKINMVKIVLSKGLPVVGGFRLDRSFMELPVGKMVWEPNMDNFKVAERHAMTVIGYDDGRSAFEIMNSWGDKWANKGCVWIPYRVFGQVCDYAYILDPLSVEEPSKDKKQITTLSGTFTFRTPDGFDWDKNEARYQKQAVLHNSEGVFLPKNPDWKVNVAFQLTTQTQKACFIYVISKNPGDKGKVNLNFPMKDERIVGAENVPLTDDLQIVVGEEGEIIIPGSKSAMKIVEAGEDQSCVLFSAKRIENIKEVVETLNQQTGTLQSRIKAHFGKELIPAGDITYAGGDQMSFKTQSTSGGYIVPIFLNITAK